MAWGWGWEWFSVGLGLERGVKWFNAREGVGWFSVGSELGRWWSGWGLEWLSVVGEGGMELGLVVGVWGLVRG